MLKTRNRIINFRVTEDEFTRLRTASLENGARCLSDYARTAILHALEGYYDHDLGNRNGRDELQALLQRLGLVEQSIAKLESMMSLRSSDDPERMSAGASA
jgi:hypothetical protein